MHFSRPSFTRPSFTRPSRAVVGKPTAVGLRSERGPILLALMLSTALVALAATFSGQLYLRVGFRNTAGVGAVGLIAGTLACGTVTATTMFARSMGSAVGVAMFGALANATIAHDPTRHRGVPALGPVRCQPPGVPRPGGRRCPVRRRRCPDAPLDDALPAIVVNR